MRYRVKRALDPRLAGRELGVRHVLQGTRRQRDSCARSSSTRAGDCRTTRRVTSAARTPSWAKPTALSPGSGVSLPASGVITARRCSRVTGCGSRSAPMRAFKRWSRKRALDGWTDDCGTATHRACTNGSRWTAINRYVSARMTRPVVSLRSPSWRAARRAPRAAPGTPRRSCGGRSSGRGSRAR